MLTKPLYQIAKMLRNVAPTDNLAYKLLMID